MLDHLLTNFEIQEYQNEPKFNGVYSKNNSPKIKHGVCVINLDEYKSIVTHWIGLYVNDDNLGTSSKKVCNIVNCAEHLLIMASTVTGCVSISVFVSSICIPVGIASSAAAIKICVITARIKKFKSIIKKK